MLQAIGLSQWVFMFLVAILGLACAMVVIFGMIQALIRRMEKEREMTDARVSRIDIELSELSELNEVREHVEIVDAATVTLRALVSEIQYGITDLYSKVSEIRQVIDLINQDKIKSIEERIAFINEHILNINEYIDKNKPTWETPIGEFKGEVDADRLNQQMKKAGDSVAIMGDNIVLNGKVITTPKDTKDIVDHIQKKVKNGDMSDFVKELK